MNQPNGTGNHHASGHTITIEVASGPLAAALAYQAAGLSVIPIRRDGSKAPTCRWEPYQQEAASEHQIRRWFAGDNPPGLAVIGGEVSGALECIDFDAEADTIFPAWCELVEAEAPGLVERLSVARTPAGGFHVRYRCPDAKTPGNTKLATNPSAPRKGQTLIETRGEGGYALAPGCPGECHATGRPYTHHSGPALQYVQAIGFAERDTLIRCAQSFDREPAPEPAKPKPPGGSGLSPGDDYNQRGPDWPAILEPHGWQAVHKRGEITYWRRPGKEGMGWSATTGAATSKSGRLLLCVFSSNAAPFPGPQGGRNCSHHDKFGAYAHLNHGGDFKAAAKALAADGYGDQKRSAAKPAAPQEGAAGSPPTGYDIILGHFQETYRPAFRRGAAAYSDAFGRDIKGAEVLLAPGLALVQKLAEAIDAPRDRKGNLDRDALPKFFKTWGPSAWKDLLDQLPEEGETGEVVEAAEEEFRAKVAKALWHHAALGREQTKTGAEVTRIERRTLLQWCELFARQGGWRDIRGYQLWCRRDETGQLQIALRKGLFGQVQGCADLEHLSATMFTRLAELYGVGSPGRACHARVVVLAPGFLVQLQANPVAEDGGDAGTDPARACAREPEAPLCPREHETAATQRLSGDTSGVTLPFEAQSDPKSVPD
jgi:hypothetical protein